MPPYQTPSPPLRSLLALGSSQNAVNFSFVCRPFPFHWTGLLLHLPQCWGFLPSPFLLQGPPRLDLSSSTDLTANGTLYGGSSTEMLGRNSMGGGGVDFLGRTSQGGGPATDILGRTTLGGSALGSRPPSFNRSTLPPPALKLGTSGDVYAQEAVENSNVGGGGRGMLRRMGSGMQPVAVAAAGGGLPLPGPMGPLAAVRGPPPPDHIPDRPGTVTTTTTQSDLEGAVACARGVPLGGREPWGQGTLGKRQTFVNRYHKT